MKYSKKRINTKIHNGTKTKKHRKISTKNKKQYQIGGINPVMVECPVCFLERRIDDMWSFHNSNTVGIDNRHCICGECISIIKRDNQAAPCPICRNPSPNNSVYKCSAPYTLESTPAILLQIRQNIQNRQNMIRREHMMGLAIALPVMLIPMMDRPDIVPILGTVMGIAIIIGIYEIINSISLFFRNQEGGNIKRNIKRNNKKKYGGGGGDDKNEYFIFSFELTKENMEKLNKYINNYLNTNLKNEIVYVLLTFDEIEYNDENVKKFTKITNEINKDVENFTKK